MTIESASYRCRNHYHFSLGKKFCILLRNIFSLLSQDIFIHYTYLSYLYVRPIKSLQVSKNICIEINKEKKYL